MSLKLLEVRSKVEVWRGAKGSELLFLLLRSQISIEIFLFFFLSMFLLFRTRCQFSRFFFLRSLSLSRQSCYDSTISVKLIVWLNPNRFKFFDRNMYWKDYRFDFVSDRSSIDSDLTTRSLNSLAMIRNNQKNFQCILFGQIWSTKLGTREREK